MAEWSKATVLKTVTPQGVVSSNLTPSAFGSQKRTFGVTTSAKVCEGDLSLAEAASYGVTQSASSHAKAGFVTT